MDDKFAELLGSTKPFVDPTANHGRPRLLQTRHLCAHYDVTDRTIDRWLRDPRVDFPRPIIIQRRRYWSERDIDAFDARQRRSTAVEPE